MLVILYSGVNKFVEVFHIVTNVAAEQRSLVRVDNVEGGGSDGVFDDCADDSVVC